MQLWPYNPQLVSMISFCWTSESPQLPSNRCKKKQNQTFFRCFRTRHTAPRNKNIRTYGTKQLPEGQSSSLRWFLRSLDLAASIFSFVDVRSKIGVFVASMGLREAMIRCRRCGWKQKRDEVFKLDFWNKLCMNMREVFSRKKHAKTCNNTIYRYFGTLEA